MSGSNSFLDGGLRELSENTFVIWGKVIFLRWVILEPSEEQFHRQPHRILCSHCERPQPHHHTWCLEEHSFAAILAIQWQFSGNSWATIWDKNNSFLRQVRLHKKSVCVYLKQRNHMNPDECKSISQEILSRIWWILVFLAGNFAYKFLCITFKESRGLVCT